MIMHPPNSYNFTFHSGYANINAWGCQSSSNNDLNLRFEGQSKIVQVAQVVTPTLIIN